MVSYIEVALASASVGLAINIGANNSAAEMGPAYGAGIRSRRTSIALIAVFCAAGAVFAGQRVISTVGYGIISPGAPGVTSAGLLVVVVSALGLIGLANAIRLPIATSHAVVGSVLGLGLFYGVADLRLAGAVLKWWVATPLVSLSLSYGAGRLLRRWQLGDFGLPGGDPRSRRLLIWCVTVSSCWMAFSAGSNSLAKAIGPAVRAGVFQPTTAAIIGGFAMALGALLLGGRMFQVVGKEITRIRPLCAVMVELISASIVFFASRFGIPVSLAEIVTCSVIGFSCAASGFRGTAGNYHVRRMMVLWPAAPVAAGAIAFVLLTMR